MNAMAVFFVLAVTVEAVVEYARTIVEHANRQTVVLQLAALLAGILLCVAAGADIYALLGVEFGSLPVVGCVLTGIFASRGANYASDILGRLQSGAG